jgi:cell division protein FtsQ
MVKKILKIALWIITGVALVLLFVFGRKWYLETPLKGVTFDLTRDHDRGFVEKDSILAYAKAICDIEHHAKISSINLMKIQKLLGDNPWIESSSAFIGLNDTLMIKAKEFEPVLRVYNQDKHSVYVTENGVIIPSSPNYSPRMIIANGQFHFPIPRGNAKITDSLYVYTGISEALAIAKAIKKDDFLAGNIGQIYKNYNEYELMVNNVSARVILGDTVAVEQRLSRLKTLLEQYSGTEELKSFKTLNLKYKNQIVCTK